MELTQHARQRKVQRNIPDAALEIILNNGSIKHVSGGAMKIFFGQKEAGEMISDLKNTIKLLERAKNGTIIISENKAITAYRVY